MDKMHNKTNKLFDDARKKKSKVTKNVNKGSAKISTGHIANVPYRCCIYCQKVFINSKFLMKHLLRRHSDELILVYKNFNDHEFNDNDLIDTLKKEFSSMKEFVSAKLALERTHETEEVQATRGEEAIHTIKRNQNISSDIASNEIGDLKEEILDVKKDLNGKVIELNNLKNEVAMKQDVNEKLASSEETIKRSQESQFIEFRQFFLNELKSLLHNQQEEISEECKSQLSELRHEIERLEKDFSAKQQQLIYSLKEEIKKELVPDIIPHVLNRKCERKKLKHSLSKTELSVSKSHLTSPPQMSSHENFACNESNSKRFRRHSGNTFETGVELTALVAEKLSQFSIAPNTCKISDADFNNKWKLLNIEKERLSKKHDSFNEIYGELNMIADQKAHSKLKRKKHYKIKFADPLTSSRNNSNHSSFEDGVHNPSLILKNRNKQFNSTKKSMPSDSRCVSQNKTHGNMNFTFHDKGASGDSVLQFSNKQNVTMKRTKLSSIKEYETSDSNEDVLNSNTLTAAPSKGSITIVAEQSKYKKKSNSTSPLLTEKRKLDSTVNSHFVEFKDSASFTSPNKGDSCDSVHLFSNKHNIHWKHAEASSFKRFETSSPIEDSQNTKSLTVPKSKTVTAKQSKYNRQLNCVSPTEHGKLNSALNGYSAQIKDTAKTSDKLSELEDYSKSDEDFDDVSSLETYKSSNEDEDSDNYS